ncbi:MAG: histidine phosphatase family protein [Chitinophagaceae bacterium]
MCKIKFLLLILLSACSITTMSQTTTRIFVVRHADREPGDNLNAAGLIRADELRRVLLLTGIDSVYSTNYTRTKKTVQPLAEAKNLPILLYDSNPPLVKRILKYNKGKTLLVAGHSNTVAQFIAACGCLPPFQHIPDTQFDNLFLVIIQHPPTNRSKKRTCRLLQMKYGLATN